MSSAEFGFQETSQKQFPVDVLRGPSVPSSGLLPSSTVSCYHHFFIHTSRLITSCQRCEVNNVGALSRNRRSLEYCIGLLLRTPDQDRHSLTRANSAELRFPGTVPHRFPPGEQLFPPRTTAAVHCLMFGFKTTSLTLHLSTLLVTSCR